MYTGFGAVTVSGDKVTTSDGITYDLAGAGRQIDLLNGNLTSTRQSMESAKLVALVGIPAALLIGYLVGK